MLDEYKVVKTTTDEVRGDVYLEAELLALRRCLGQAREEERLRLARELHDGSIQDLISLNFRLAELERRTPDSLQAALPELRQEVVRVIKQLRNLINDLRPGALSDMGFSLSLESHLGRLERDHKDSFPRLQLELDERIDLVGDELKLCLFRAAQEASTNALKHAQATHLFIRLSLSSQAVSLCVQDDGLGFFLPQTLLDLTQQDHFGLVGVAERCSLLGGTLHIDTAPQKGTKVFISLPLSSARETQ